jgi:hypothetical protein
MATLVALVANGLSLIDRHDYELRLAAFAAQVRQWMTASNQHDDVERPQAPWLM